MWKKVVAFGCLGFALLLISGVVGLYVLVHSMNRDENDFQENVEKQVNPIELQKWAQQMIVAHPIESRSGDYEIPVRELPVSLRSFGKLKPEMAFVSQQGPDAKPAVVIFWGGGFGHWGLIVGDKDLRMSSDQNETDSQWIDGVYFFWDK
jgi:hypothetical protein